MMDNFGSVESYEIERQKRRQRRNNKSYDLKPYIEDLKPPKPKRNAELLIDDPLDEYFEYYLPRQSRGRGRTRLEKRKLYM